MTLRPDPTGRSTNKYYASGARSAFRRSAADSRMAPGTEVLPGESPVTTPVSRVGETSTDKYYREGGAGGKPQPVSLPSPKARAKTQLRGVQARTDSTIYISDKDGITEARDMAISMLDNGASRVVIAITDQTLLVRARSVFDALVGQNVIDREQRNRIYVELHDNISTPVGKESRSVSEILGAPEAGDVGEEESAFLGDPAAFLSSGMDDDEAYVETAPTVAVPEAPESDFDSDFLSEYGTAQNDNPDVPIEDILTVKTDGALPAAVTPPDLSKVPEQPKKTKKVKA